MIRVKVIVGGGLFTGRNEEICIVCLKKEEAKVKGRLRELCRTKDRSDIELKAFPGVIP